MWLHHFSVPTRVMTASNRLIAAFRFSGFRLAVLDKPLFGTLRLTRRQFATCPPVHDHPRNIDGGVVGDNAFDVVVIVVRDRRGVCRLLCQRCLVMRCLVLYRLPCLRCLVRMVRYEGGYQEKAATDDAAVIEEGWHRHRRRWSFAYIQIFHCHCSFDV